MIGAVLDTVYGNSYVDYGPQFVAFERSAEERSGFFLSSGMVKPWIVIRIGRVYVYSITIINVMHPATACKFLVYFSDANPNIFIVYRSG